MILKDNFVTLIEKNNSNVINNKYTEYINNLPDNLENTSNFILYGPCGTGKYSEALKIIERYSPSYLKYEKKMIINSSKNEHIIKISDIHYEIDLENLTCNSKILLNDIYNNIIDAIQSSKDKKGIILCKNFHEINNEIIEIFYSYMQKNLVDNLILKFIILTEHLSFVPTNIQDVCKILYYSKLSYSNYIKLSNANNKKILSEKQKIDKNSNKTINMIFSSNINYNNIRNILYDILIYNLNIYDCMYYIVNNVISKKIKSSGEKMDPDFINKILVRTCILFKYYNNNYRPIYHLEAFILYLIKLVNEDEFTNSTK